ncbi:hypothetical protein JB92DRAFT_2200086 [Gautieria morchelliformis]|nr:hypothetical protein JB92DRAFT_2200086 [Gautieria morchelliformis]
MLMKFDEMHRDPKRNRIQTDLRPQVQTSHYFIPPERPTSRSLGQLERPLCSITRSVKDITKSRVIKRPG